MYRLMVVAVIALTLSVSGALGLARDTESVPDVVPASRGDIVGVDAAAPDDVASLVTSLQARLRDLPQDYVSWANLGLGYVEQARVTGNPSYYAQAEQSIARSLEIQAADNAPALAATSALDAARHDFDDSLAAAEAALAIDPYQVGALAVRVDALTELGRYDEQLKALRIADRRQPGVPVAARYAYAQELRGQLVEASRTLTRAASSARAADRAFLLTLLADIERRRGLLDAADEHLDLALRLSPEHVPALASQARLSTARGDYDRAVRRWENVVQTLPLPEYLTELGELYEFLGRDVEAQQQYDVVATSNALFSDSGVNTDLEAALFAADHGDPADALPSARAEWDRRKSIHVADVLGWTLHRAGDDEAALPLARAATRLGTAEARFWLHRGTIEAALGLDAEARKHLRRGLTTDPGASPLQLQQARATLADLEAGR